MLSAGNLSRNKVLNSLTVSAVSFGSASSRAASGFVSTYSVLASMKRRSMDSINVLEGIGALVGDKSCSSCLSYLAANVWSAPVKRSQNPSVDFDKFVGNRVVFFGLGRPLPLLTQFFVLVVSFSRSRFARFWRKVVGEERIK